MEVINFKEKKVILLTTEENEPYQNQKKNIINAKNFNVYYRKYYKNRDQCHFTRKYKRTGHDSCNLRYK